MAYESKNMTKATTGRREFLKTAGLTIGSGVLSAGHASAADSPARKPNLLVVMTDQQSADAMSCVIGRGHIHTPNMDSLATAGTRFARAYTANPLCIPARASMFTGCFPHETGIQTNTNEKIDPDRFPCMAEIFRDAGYDTGFFGKWHLPYDPSRPDQHGFDVNVEKPALYNAAPIAEFIRKERKNPFLAVASFVNPHNICEWPRGQELPGGPIGEPPAPERCPPLRHNSQPPENEPDIMAHMRRAYQAHRLFPVGDFSDDKWRQFIWAYYRLVEKVDEQVGTVLEALRQSGREEDTVIVFLSDHGECQGAHRWNQKTVLFDESARVPFVIVRKGVIPTGTSDALVHTGVDLIPTLCEFAGVEKPKNLPGRSLVRAALGRPGLDEPSYLVISNHMVQCEPVDGVLLQPHGRMVRSHRYKYCLYSLGRRREFLVDMGNDPGEMRNLAEDAAFNSILREHRAYLASFAAQHKDEMARTMLAGLET